MTNKKAQQAAVNVRVFLPEDKEIARILKYCNFSPTEYDWTLWIDDLGNELKINEDKSIQLNLVKDMNYGNVSDLYINSPLNFIFEKSIWMSLSFCEENSALLWLLGKDLRLRVAKYSKLKYDGISSPVALGMTAVRLCIKQMDNSALKYTLNRSNKNWVSNLPFEKQLISELENENKKLTEIIIEDIGVEW